METAENSEDVVTEKEVDFIDTYDEQAKKIIDVSKCNKKPWQNNVNHEK